MKTITYNNHQYPIRTFTMQSEETGVVSYTIADTQLQADLFIHRMEDYVDDVAKGIDRGIYFYVDEGVLDLPAEEICRNHLDIPFKFISEEE